MYAVDSSKYRWVSRSDVVFPDKPYQMYKLYLGNFWIVNDCGDLLFWDNIPQCNPNEKLAAAILRTTQPHLDSQASVMHIDRAWVPVNPRDYC